MGLYQQKMLDKIRMLERKIKDTPAPPPEPEKPAVIGGGYQPAREVSTAVDKKRKAGLVETKTPELMDWENKVELESLGNS